ncbi:MAG: ABC transporter ATP-binding protein [Flavobacteriaceae bacterium]|nr:ABC transporter ATP-binding protein [Flavobacteriaceae bacterium]
MDSKKNHIALKVENLSIGYQSKKETTVITSNLNFEINRGAFVCILGKNGIGKSTLLRTLSKVQSPIEGTVFLNGSKLSSFTNPELAKNLSLVLTEKLPESNLTVFELIALGRQPYTNWIGKLTNNDLDIIFKSIKLTGLEHLINKKYYELSDGQFQRVLISRALAQDTNTIILDEPTAHLDIEHTLETFQLLKELAVKENKTIIISTHEIQLAIQSAEELFLMTENDFIGGKPSDLIKDKSIDALFSNNSIIFDAVKEQFVLKQPS